MPPPVREEEEADHLPLSNPKSLECLCLGAYLTRLQLFCSGYVELRSRKCLSSRIAGPMLERVKRELERGLSGTASSNLREAMIQRVLTTHKEATLERAVTSELFNYLR